jgi:CheY-like chemotaxis protein
VADPEILRDTLNAEAHVGVEMPTFLGLVASAWEVHARDERMTWLLVADDDLDACEALASALRELGFDVRTAADGADVVWMLDEADPLPALVLLDAIMPRVTAVETLRAMRSLGRANRIPVVVMAGSAAEAADLVDSGATEVLRKPLSLDSVLAAIARLCDAPRSPRVERRTGTHLSVVRNAIDILLQKLSVLPPCEEVDALFSTAGNYLREAEKWRTSPPTAHDREALMKRVLALHVDLARIERARRA